MSFFPQLVAGPIERASNLLPQVLNSRIFKYKQGVQGCIRLILWGMFKKVVIADSLAYLWRVDFVFNNYQNLDGGILILIFIFQFKSTVISGGYSDIARLAHQNFLVFENNRQLSSHIFQEIWSFLEKMAYLIVLMVERLPLIHPIGWFKINGNR